MPRHVTHLVVCRNSKQFSGINGEMDFWPPTAWTFIGTSEHVQARVCTSPNMDGYTHCERGVFRPRPISDLSTWFQYRYVFQTAFHKVYLHDVPVVQYASNESVRPSDSDIRQNTDSIHPRKSVGNPVLDPTNY